MKKPSATKKNVSDVLGVIFTHRLVVPKTPSLALC